MATIFATIGPRSGVDRGTGDSSIAVQSTRDDSTMKSPRSQLDHAVIAVRSDRDRGVLPQPAYAVGLEFDAPKIFTKSGGSRLTGAVGLESDAPRIFTKSGGSRFTWPSDR